MVLPVSVILADDLQFLRAGLRRLLESIGGIEVVGGRATESR